MFCAAHLTKDQSFAAKSLSAAVAEASKGAKNMVNPYILYNSSLRVLPVLSLRLPRV